MERLQRLDLLISATSCAQGAGRKIIEFDDSLAPYEIPAGTWPMKDVMWAGFGPRLGVPCTIVIILSGAEFTDLRMIGGQITIVNRVMQPHSSPVSGFGNGTMYKSGCETIAEHLDCEPRQLLRCSISEANRRTSS